MLTPAEYRDPEKNARIETRLVHLRCPACTQERAFDLDAVQLERLRIKGLMEAHCSFCGGGRLWTPVQPEELGEMAPAEPRHVLLVGNDAASLRIVAEMLGAWDASVDVVCSGREACERLAVESYDLMVADFRLADLPAPQLLELVRRNGLLPPERIVILAEENRAAMQPFLESSGCAYCRKPVTFAEFSEQVEGLLSSRQTQNTESSPVLI